LLTKPLVSSLGVLIGELDRVVGGTSALGPTETLVVLTHDHACGGRPRLANDLRRCQLLLEQTAANSTMIHLEITIHLVLIDRETPSSIASNVPLVQPSLLIYLLQVQLSRLELVILRKRCFHI
jgi:hypothetical protein